MKNMKKLMVILLMTVTALTFTACKPAFEYDEAAAVERAQSVVDSINAGDYQAVFDSMTEEMQAQLPAETLKNAFDPILTDSGKFVEYKSTLTSAVTQNGVDYIVTVVTCTYENATRIYTISLTKDDMAIGGLYLK